MTIPSVVQGIIETGDGKVFELDSPKGSMWLESIGSFRFEPSNGGKPYTVRKESGIYWYGCRKIARQVRKKYIGKSSEVTVAKLEEIAEALEIPPVPRVNEVAQEVAQEVTEVAQDRLTALESQVANLQKAVEALQEALPGKLESGDSLELPKVDNEVAERLQNELGNLKAENEKLRADYAALLESSTHVTNKLREEVRELRSQLQTERADREEIEAQLSNLKQKSDLTATAGHLYKEIENLKERNRLLLIKSREERQKLQEELATLKYRDESQSRRLQEKQTQVDDLEIQLEELQSELTDLKQKPVAAGKDLPEAADLLNQLKTRRKKSKADLADLEAILEILED